MGMISLTQPQIGQPDTTEDPKIQSNFTTIQNAINGGLDTNNLSASAAIARTQLATGAVFLALVNMGASGTAAYGTCVQASPGITVTLPAPTASQVIAVHANNGVSVSNPVTVAGTNINGVGLLNASSFLLGTPSSSVVLEGDGTNWLIVSGSPNTSGSANIAASQSTSSTTYTTLATPDQVQNLYLPANGLIAVWYQATWQESISGNASAAIFLGANQIKQADNNGAPNVNGTVAGLGGTANTNTPLATNPLGLNSAGGNVAYPGDVTTGQVVGAGGSSAKPGPCYIFAAAGTYTVSVQFKVVSGSVTVSNRRLYVQVVPYG